MKVLISLIAMLLAVSCGKTIEDRSQIPTKGIHKSGLSESETWTLLSEQKLPSKVKVEINGLEFVDECKGTGSYVIERNDNNASLHISTVSTFRDEYFKIDIANCEDGSSFYSEEYVDQMLIEHPDTGAVTIILRLRNF